MSTHRLSASHRRGIAATLAVALATMLGVGAPIRAVAADPVYAADAPLAVAPAFAPTTMRFNDCCYMTSMAAADLDGDGDLDLVTGNGLSYDVSILLGDGAHGFAEPVTLPPLDATYGFVAVAVGDVDGDARPDLVVTGFADTALLLYRNDGGGGFSSPANLDIGAGRGPRAAVLADVDGDGQVDLVTANGDSSDVAVLIGDGHGGFAAAQVFAAGSYPTALAVVDVSGDGAPDLVTANADSSDVTVLLGDGHGQFAAPLAIAIGAGARPTGVAAADLDGDGIADIVTSNAASDGSEFPPPELPGTVSVLASLGDGRFAPAVQRSAGAGSGRAEAVALGDVSGDGITDIVVTRVLDNSVAWLVGDGAGGFADAVKQPTGTGPSPLVLGDVTGDGHVDVVTANAVGSSLTVLPGDGAGHVGSDALFGVGTYPFSIVAADFNADGRPDVVTANIQSDDVSVLLNDGQGGFAPETRVGVGTSPAAAASGDVDGDGHADLVVANLGSGDVSVLLGDGAGGFGAAHAFSVGEGFQSPYAVALGDANGDGHLDIATANTNISNDGMSVLLGDGQGSFAAATLYTVGDGCCLNPQGIAFEDVTGDGRADIVTANLGSSDLSLFVGDGSGGFAAARHLEADAGPVALAAADVTGDGYADLVVLNQTAQDVSVLAGDGAGGFAAAAHYAIYPSFDAFDYNPWPWGLALGDVDGDGALDIVTANTQNDTVSVLPNDGAGHFDTFAFFGAGARPGAIVVADIDGDGAADLAVANRDNNDVAVLFNRGRSESIFADGFD